MTTRLRSVHQEDVPDCGRIIYEAFRDIAESHRFPPDFPSAEVGSGLVGELLASPGFDGFVAEEEGRVIGSIFVSRRSPVGGISVITVAPESQDRTVGRQLMGCGMKHLEEQGHARQQLVQAAYHNRSLCLYAKLGFVAADILSNLQGEAIQAEISGRRVRPAETGDAPACNALCSQVHGFDRQGEVARSIERGSARVVENDGRITGYTTGVGFLGHGVGESNTDLQALIASVDQFAGPGLLIPTGNGELFRWCLDHGLRVVQQMILMDTDPSGPPVGCYWPSVLC